MTSRPYDSRRTLIILLVSALVTYAAMNYLIIDDVVGYLDSRAPYKSIAYAAWIGAGFVTLFAVIVTAPLPMLGVLLILALASLTTNYAYVALAKTALTVDVIEWLPHEAAQLPNLWGEYAVDLALAVAKAVTALAILVWIGRKVRRSLWMPLRAPARIWLGVISLASFLALHGLAMKFQPPLSVAETNLFVFGVPSLLASTPSPQPISVAPAGLPLVDKIVLVVDESVTHEAYEKLLAGRVAQFPHIDFGEAASTSNCSAPSNALLRWGIQRKRVREPGYDPRTNPMIWGFARGAGFRTVLIDGQSRGSLQNYVNSHELKLIDEFVAAQLPGDTDHAVAAMLNARLRQPGRAFIYVVKEGAHFPYDLNYPAGLVPADAPRTAKYSAAVSHATGGFFERLSSALPFEKILIIYTSDHGQDFNQRAAHCNPDPVAEEYSVPLIAVTAEPALQSLMASSPLHSRASHGNIFPTLLHALGYPQQWVEDAYGPMLGGPPSPYLTYVYLGWRAGAPPSERHTVKTTDFVESAGFPRRRPSEPKRLMLDPAARPG